MGKHGKIQEYLLYFYDIALSIIITIIVIIIYIYYSILYRSIYIYIYYIHIVFDGTHIYQNRSFQTPMIFEQVTAAMPAAATSPAAAAAFL